VAVRSRQHPHNFQASKSCSACVIRTTTNPAAGRRKPVIARSFAAHWWRSRKPKRPTRRCWRRLPNRAQIRCELAGKRNAEFRFRRSTDQRQWRPRSHRKSGQQGTFHVFCPPVAIAGPLEQDRWSTSPVAGHLEMTIRPVETLFIFFAAPRLFDIGRSVRTANNKRTGQSMIRS
jgi:hypothetical protein